MKNKKIIIFSIIILSILTITLTLFTIYLLIKTPKFTFNYKNNTEVIYEQSYDIQSINNIKINTISSDIKFKPSTDNNLKVIAYGNEDSEFKIKQDDYNLNINYDIKNNFCIGICYQEDYIVIYIPNTYNNKININTTSGDISGIDLTNADIDLITTSGDIQINNINKLDALSTSGDINIRNVNEINLKVTSGEVNINNINNKVNIQTTSGDVEINNLRLTENSKIKTNSGEIEIDKTNNIYIDANTTSGEVDIKNNNRKAEYELKVETTSGDVTVNDY